MFISISTYQVKKEDTLHSVAEKLGISTEALKRYHNTYCELKDLIGNDLKGIQEILIPPKEKIAEFKEQTKTLSQQNDLPATYLSKNFYASLYEVNEIFEEMGEQKISIDYNVAIKLYEATSKGYRTDVNCFDYKKDNNSPDDKISTLSIECMKSILPISFLVPAQGKISGLHDHKALVNKFTRSREDLEDFFIGEVYHSYLEKFENYISDETFLLRRFQSSILYQVLFPKMEWFHKRTPWMEEFFIVPNSMSINCSFQAEYNHENPDYVETIISGKLAEHCSLQEILKGVKLLEKEDEAASAEIEIKYYTGKHTKQLTRLESKIILWFEDEKYSEHRITFLAKVVENKAKRNHNTLVE